MPISRERKEQVVAELSELLERAESVVFVNHAGLTVQELQAIRHELRDVGTPLMVAKNRLIRIALANAGLSLVDSSGRDHDTMLTQETAMAFGFEQPNLPAEKLIELADRFDDLELKGGFYGVEPVAGVAGVERISKMRSKLDALADVIAIITPARGLRQLQTVAQGAPRRLMGLGGNAVGTVEKLQAVKSSEAA